MRELARLGHRAVMLISDSNHLTDVPRLAGPHLLETVEGVDVHWIRTRKFTGAKSMGRILSWLDFELRLWLFSKRALPRPDVVIVSSLSLLTIFNGFWLKFRYRCRLVFEVRDIWPLTIIEEGGFSPRNPLVMGLAAVERLAYRRADVIVGTMPNLAAHVSEVAPRHAPVHCVPFGVDVDMIEKARPLPPGWVKEHIPANKFVVCHAGTIGITNALDTLFECARTMRERSDVHFLILGEGGLKAHYEALSADLPNVTFAGTVAKDQVGAALAACDLLYFSVHDSKVWKYGLSLNKVIDYMLAGKPVVASYAGHTTMVEEAGAGTIVAPRDPAALAAEIARYAGMMPEARRAIGQKGRDWLLRNRQYRDLAQSYLSIATGPDSCVQATR
jgi:glycosyltransferase involved in cell wall biosynthesis